MAKKWRSKYPPKKVTKRQVNFALNLFNTESAVADIEAMPPGPIPKQRKKRVELESKVHGAVVLEAKKRYPGTYIFSIRDERGMWLESERNKQAGEKRPDMFIAKKKVITLGCKCNTPLIYSALETKCRRCMELVGIDDIVFGGAFIEVKSSADKYLTKKGEVRQSKHIQGQYQTLLKLRREGYFSCFAGGYEEAMNVIDWYIKGDGWLPFEHLYST
jgi:hypothetical protein